MSKNGLVGPLEDKLHRSNISSMVKNHVISTQPNYPT
jgi:hypothetical protein